MDWCLDTTLKYQLQVYQPVYNPSNDSNVLDFDNHGSGYLGMARWFNVHS